MESAAQQLSMFEGYLDLVVSGRKTTTVRLDDPARLGPITFVFEHADGRVSTVDAVVTQIDSKKISELTDLDATRDGFADLAELLTALEHHYPGFDPESTVDVVYFHTFEAAD
jgi:cytidine deaminase